MSGVDDLVKLAPIPTVQWSFGPTDIGGHQLPAATVEIVLVSGVPGYRWVGVVNGLKVCWLSDTVRPSAKLAAFVWARWAERTIDKYLAQVANLPRPDLHPVPGDLGSVPA
jgi:hypothetical protein